MTQNEASATWDSVADAWGEHAAAIDDQLAATSDWMLAQLDVHPGHTVLDIAAGAGSFGFRLAREVEGITLITSDFAPQMVEVARRRASELGIAADVRQFDATAIDLPDDSVDRVACRMGYMLMPDPGAAFRDARRVLRPDGRFAIGVWGGPSDNAWVVVPGIALMQQGVELPGRTDPFEPGGMFSLSDPAQLEAMLRGAGFSDVIVEEVRSFQRSTSFDDFWSLPSKIAGPVAAAIATLTPEQVEALRATMRELLEPYRDGEGYAIPTTALCAAATT